MKLSSRVLLGIFVALFLALATFLIHLVHPRSPSIALKPFAPRDRYDYPEAFAAHRIAPESEVSRPKAYSVHEVEADMLQRRRVKDEACSRHGLDRPGNDSLHRVYPWEYLISKEYSLIWCNVFKSGSSSWMYIFNQLAGHEPRFLKKTKGKPPMTLAREFYTRPSAEELLATWPTSLSFIVARHPFERLVSGYRDKILNALKGSYHDKMGKEIQRRYGRAKFRKPTFPDFVRYILEVYETTSEMDMHWTPTFSFCNVCQLNFSMIIRFETFNRDQDFIVQQAAIQDRVEVIKLNQAKDGEDSKSVMNKYVSQLDPDLHQSMCHFYRYDFEIFGYSYPGCEWS
eukprot:maker-scaffold176_size284796-snap-gene-1.18 protein:Tk06855 transcript:maker-scaffold176_size284796-snap-gene-1.18-mRNA-1 annotation:"carbohydrate sulfotransferase 11-like"